MPTLKTFANHSTVSLSDVTAHITSPSITSPVSTAAKTALPSMTKTTVASSEPEIAFPAVLKGSKQRVPPPVPPRGSPKAKRGGANSQSSLDTKGDFLTISTSEIPPQTPFTSSDDDFSSYRHDFHVNLPAACARTASESSVKITQLQANSFLNFVEEADSITERSHAGKDLIAQTTMMARFNVDATVREHLDTGDYEDNSFTDSSSEEHIVVHELHDDVSMEVKGRQSKSPSQFLKGVVTSIGDKLTRKTPTEIETPSEKASVHNVKSSDLVIAAKSLKKTPKGVSPTASPKDIDKSNGKSGLMSGLTKRLNFNQTKHEKNRKEPEKPKPKVEIKTYKEEHARGMTKDEVVCHRKAKTKIDMFQKHIWKVQSDSENSSRRSSLSSSQELKPSLTKTTQRTKVERRSSDVVKETKKIFEPIEYTHGSTTSIDKKLNLTLTATTLSPISRSLSGNVHDKIKQFSQGAPSKLKPPVRTPRQKKEIKRSSFKKKSDKKIYKMRKDIEEIL